LHTHSALRPVIRFISALTLIVALIPPGAPVSMSQAAPFCASDQAPEFPTEFTPLVGALAGAMGDPLECAHAQDGSLLLTTSGGLAFVRLEDGAPTFTNGFENWALTGDGVTYWTVDPSALAPPPAVDPCLAYAPYDAPQRACPLANGAETFGIISTPGSLNAYRIDLAAQSVHLQAVLSNLSTTMTCTSSRGRITPSSGSRARTDSIRKRSTPRSIRPTRISCTCTWTPGCNQVRAHMRYVSALPHPFRRAPMRRSNR
jgi:hypothetical protein